MLANLNFQHVELKGDEIFVVVVGEEYNSEDLRNLELVNIIIQNVSQIHILVKFCLFYLRMLS